MSRILAVVFAVSTLSILTSCLSSGSSKVFINPSLSADESYYQSFEAHTKRAKVINNFETRFTVAVTMLSPEFRTNLAKRYETLYTEAQPILEEGSQKTSFFIVFYASEKNMRELENTHIWNIKLDSKDGRSKPSLVKKVTDKARWSPFFSDINIWTEEYLIVFDQAEKSNSELLTNKSSILLNIANSDAQLKLEW